MLCSFLYSQYSSVCPLCLLFLLCLSSTSRASCSFFSSISHLLVSHTLLFVPHSNFWFPRHVHSLKTLVKVNMLQILLYSLNSGCCLSFFCDSVSRDAPDHSVLYSRTQCLELLCVAPPSSVHCDRDTVSRDAPWPRPTPYRSLQLQSLLGLAIMHDIIR